MAVGGLLHESANQIIDDQVDLQFFGNEFWTLATQHVQVQDGFELMKVQFHCPTLPIKRAHFLRRIKFLIKQSSYQDHSAGAKARGGYFQTEHPKNKLIGQRGK